MQKGITTSSDLCCIAPQEVTELPHLKLLGILDLKPFYKGKDYFKMLRQHLKPIGT